MKVLVDENIPLITAEELRLKGFDVTDILRHFMGRSQILKFISDLST